MASFDFSSGREPLKLFSQAGLTDIILLLLIFFLLTSSFIPQFGIKVTLPRAEAGAPTEQQHVTVSISSEGTFYVNQNEVPGHQLLDAVRNADGDHTAMILRADENATVGQFARVANIAKALNMTVLMATQQRDGP